MTWNDAMTMPINPRHFGWTVDGRVATITLDRPNKLNALYPEMILSFVDMIERVRRDQELRVQQLKLVQPTSTM